MIWWFVACFPTHAVAPGTSEAAPGAESATVGYVGTAACGACHPAAAEVWARTGHAKALATLVEAQHSADPECLACHVTAKGAVDNVGCEACHGPGGGHALAPGPGYGKLPKHASACLGCHTRDNSPDFVWSGYWPQVEHGR